MGKDTIENTVLAVLSFLLGLYFGADYADYFLTSLPYQAFFPSTRFWGRPSTSKSSSRRAFTLIRGLV